MPYTLLSNKKNTSVVIHVTPANTTMTIAGNTTNGSNVAISNETLTGGYVAQAFWGTDGHIKLKRGANLVAIYDSTGYKDYAGSGMPLTNDQTATLVIEFTSANSYLTLEMQKVGNFTSDYLGPNLS